MRYLTGLFVFLALMLLDVLEMLFFVPLFGLDGDWPHSPAFAKKLWLP